MTHPIECSDEYGLEGIKDAEDLAKWFNSWLADTDSKECKIEKVGPFEPGNYSISHPIASTPND